MECHRIADQLHKKHIHPHVFSACVCNSIFLQANIPIRHVQKILGHKRLQSTMVYLHVTTQAQTDSHLRVSQVMLGGVVMSPIQDIFRTYGPEYLAMYEDRMPQTHKKVMNEIFECRSGSFGTILYDCEDCRSIHPVSCCCGNRHCLSCQQDKADEWLRRQMEKLLPTHYFLLTITLPEQLRDVVRSNQKATYASLFSCTHESLKKLAKDKRFLGSSRIGYLAVLHTWGGNLQFHPHLHLVIPGGAL